MTHGRSRSRTGAFVAAMVAGVLSAMFCQAAAAQDRLPNDLLSSDNLSAEQRDLVNLYVEYWAAMLRGPEAPTNEQVVTARSRLIEPLNQPGASQSFRRYYPGVVAERLQGALQAPSLIARLNTMILASHLGTLPQVVTLIQQGLQDQSPAVRYWAVKAIRTSLQQGAAAGLGAGGGGAPQPNVNPAAQMDAGTRRQLLDQLERMLANERALEVLEQVLLAMVELEAPGNNALERVVAALNRRVAAHVGEPLLPFRPETSGMQAAYRRILIAQQNRGGMNQLLDRIAAVAAKYMFLLAGQAQAAELTPALQEDYAAMASLTFTILDQIRQSRNANVPVPTQFQFNQDLINRNWDSIRQGAQQFRDMLTGTPFNLDPTEVTVTQ